MNDNEKKGAEMLGGAVQASGEALGGCVEGCGTKIILIIVVMGLIGMLLKACGILDG